MHAAIIGIDPGARNSGVVLVRPHTPPQFHTVLNEGDILPPPADYLHDVISAVYHLIDQGNVEHIALESLVRPNWHVGGGRAAKNPEALMGTAVVLGAVLAYRWPLPLHLVPPVANGGKPLAAYPAELISDGEKRRPGWQMRIGTGELRHVRSAYDVALNSKIIAKRAKARA